MLLADEYMLFIMFTFNLAASHTGMMDIQNEQAEIEDYRRQNVMKYL